MCFRIVMPGILSFCHRCLGLAFLKEKPWKKHPGEGFPIFAWQLKGNPLLGLRKDLAFNALPIRISAKLECRSPFCPTLHDPSMMGTKEGMLGQPANLPFCAQPGQSSCWRLPTMGRALSSEGVAVTRSKLTCFLFQLTSELVSSPKYGRAASSPKYGPLATGPPCPEEREPWRPAHVTLRVV